MNHPPPHAARRSPSRALVAPALALILALGASPSPANAEVESLSTARRLNGYSTQSAFDQAKEAAFASTVRLVRNGKLITHGAIVSEQGHLLTKASACIGAREAIFADGTKQPVRIRRREKETDLALLQILAKDKTFTPVQWADETEPPHGSWAISADPDLRGLKLGVIGAQPRSIDRSGGVIGVMLGRDGAELGGVAINQVVPRSAGATAGLKKGDLITKVNDRPVQQRQKVIDLVSSHDPGDLVRVQVKRGDKHIAYNVTLGHRSVTFELFNRNLRMSGPVSKRKDDFPRILQHDLPLPPQAMGGPLLDLHGKALGINVARADRVTTYALPADIVKQALKKLMR